MPRRRVERHTWASEVFVSVYEREPDPSRSRLIVALVAFLVVALSVCGGAYLVYREALLVGVTGTGGLALLSTRTPTPGGPEPTALWAAPLVPTITPRPEESSPAGPGTPNPPSTTASGGEETSTPATSDVVYAVVHGGCETPGGSSLKGQVFDLEGEVVQGADVWVTLDGWPYDQPVRSNDAGWYEFYLNDGLVARIARLEIDGEEQELVGDVDGEYPVRPDCFQHVDLRAQVP